MPPTNDTGYPLVVGPDVNGNHFAVGVGEDYELPEPPRTVSEDEAQAQAEEDPSEDEGEEQGSTPVQTGTPPAPEIPFGEHPDGETTDTEGASE